jgi:leucyl aminopeptidase
MNILIQKSNHIPANSSVLLVETSGKNLAQQITKNPDKQVVSYVKSMIEKKSEEIIGVNLFTHHYLYFCPKSKADNNNKTKEIFRNAGNKLFNYCSEHEIEQLYISTHSLDQDLMYCLIEGLMLSQYQFDKYKSDKKEIKALQQISIVDGALEKKKLKELLSLNDAISACRDMVNEPVSFMNTKAFTDEIKKMFATTSASIEVMNKPKIVALKMNGLLAVNQGSVHPPAFVVIEWKPAAAKNKKPVVFIGKGLVFDTGGINLKSGNHMEDMKQDMAGGAAVASAMYAIANNNVPVYAVGLIPVTDNRPSGNSLVPGDIINYSDGTAVEVLNADAEGRLILADAILFAAKYKPQLVITIATLTGAAQAAIGSFATVGMQADALNYFHTFQTIGEDIHERIVEFPFWEDYNELIKSDTADIKNIGGGFAGAITAGKFLHHFCKFPFIHLDIAGTAFLDKKNKYLCKGATGVGVRLFYRFVKKLSNTK